MDIKAIESASSVILKTEGLAERCGYEISIALSDKSLVSPACDFLDMLSAYIDGGNIIAPGQTLGYGCWITKTEANNDRELNFFEQVPYTEVYRPGINTTLELWVEQQRLCASLGASFTAPTFEQMVVISAGVLEGDAAEGVRYPSPEHMSGWWITTDLYDGNTKSLKIVHLQHFAIKRPDLVKYIALPFKYRFHQATEAAWYDEKIED